MTVTSLRDVKCGQKAKVLEIKGEGSLRRHIMDMGITRGVELQVNKIAPLGDPIEITVRDYELSLRKEDAENILVEMLS